MLSISLVTSCYNAAEMLPVTLRSIRAQTLLRHEDVQFEYIIVDAGSKDNSLQIIDTETQGLPVKIISEPDKGLYDGLAKGFAACTGKIMGYINAGDFLHATALETLRDAFTETSAPWMTGYCTFGNERAQPWRVELPFRYREEFFQCGLHGTVLPTLQQESTFWRAGLLEGFDWERFRSLKLAGDYFLWQHFSKSGPPAILHSLIGTFCAHPHQLSGNYAAYEKELKSLCRPPTAVERIRARLDRPFWKAPEGIKRRFGGGSHIVYDPQASRYRYMKVIG